MWGGSTIFQFAFSNHLYVESKANGANEPIYKTETDSQTSKTSLWLPVRKCGWRGGIS